MTSEGRTTPIVQVHLTRAGRPSEGHYGISENQNDRDLQVVPNMGSKIVQGRQCSASEYLFQHSHCKSYFYGVLILMVVLIFD